MKKKIYEMEQKLTASREKAEQLMSEGKYAEAKEELKNAKEIKNLIAEMKDAAADEDEDLISGAKDAIKNKDIAKNASLVRAMLKKACGATLTEAENSLLLPTVETPEGANGEVYILPQDIRTNITKKMRDYRSLRDEVGYLPAGALTGQFPIEDFDTLTELVDFADGTDGTESKDIKFTQVKFSLKEKAAFVKLSNTLLALSDEALLEYVAEIFAKKAVITENKMIIAALKKDKTAVTIDGYKGLKSAINTKLDPAALPGTVVLTNQDGFNFLDSQVDEIGRPILQPDPTQPTKMMFKGYPIKMFANSLMPSDGTVAPIFFGNLKEAVKVVDLAGKIAFAASAHAGFMSNTTVARLIEFVDVVQCDKSDLCYCYGTIETAAAAAAATAATAATAETGEENTEA